MFPHHSVRFVLLALAAFTVTAAAQPSENVINKSSSFPTFHSTVSEVRVTFFATNEDHRALAALSPSDFAIVDNDRVVRNFRSFNHSNETSLDVVVLVDISESIAPRFRATINDVLQLVAREQSIPDDNLSILSFGGSSEPAPRENSSGMTSTGVSSTGMISTRMTAQTSPALRPAVLCSGGCRAADSTSRIQSAKSSGTTPLYDALIFGSDFLSHQHRAAARSVLVLFSDGNDTISLHSSGDALRSALDAGAVIYSVDMASTPKQSSSHRLLESSGAAFLQQLAEQTGGRYFSPQVSQSDGAATVLNAVLEDLHASYVVTYELPTHQPGFHSLRLLPTHNLNLTFHNRTGYFYESSLR